MATAAPISPVSPIQIPCKLNIDFEEDIFSICAKLKASTPTATSPCTLTLEKRGRTTVFSEDEVDAEACSSPRKRRTVGRKRRNRHVRFRHDTKQFDGLQPFSEALETTVWNYYTLQSIQSADDILSLFNSRQEYLAVFKQVGSAINNLAELLENLTQVNETVPVLPRGGGRGVLLGFAHIPTFKQLRDMFVLALQRA